MRGRPSADGPGASATTTGRRAQDESGNSPRSKRAHCGLRLARRKGDVETGTGLRRRKNIGAAKHRKRRRQRGRESLTGTGGVWKMSERTIATSPWRAPLILRRHREIVEKALGRRVNSPKRDRRAGRRRWPFPIVFSVCRSPGARDQSPVKTPEAGRRRSILAQAYSRRTRQCCETRFPRRRVPSPRPFSPRRRSPATDRPLLIGFQFLIVRNPTRTASNDPMRLKGMPTT